MTAEDITQQELVISKLLRQDIEKYKSLFPHVSAAIQLSSSSGTDGRYPTKGDTINYIYTNIQHKNQGSVLRYGSSTSELQHNRETQYAGQSSRS
jgi:DNA polymerase elongation subunit (family B)